MSSTSPSPNSPLPVSPPSPVIVPPPQLNSPPPLPDSPPPLPDSPPPLPSLPPTQPNSPPPIATPPTQSPPPPLPPLTTPPIASPPPNSPPPQSPPNAPPPLPSIPPRTSPPPPVPSDPPTVPPPSINAPLPSINPPLPPPQPPNEPPRPPTPSPPTPSPPRNSPPPPLRSPNTPNTSPPPPRGSPPPPSSIPPRESSPFTPPPPTNSSSPIVPSRSPPVVPSPSNSPPPPTNSSSPIVPSRSPPVVPSPSNSPPPPTNSSSPIVPSRSPPVVPPPSNSPPRSSPPPSSSPPPRYPPSSTVPSGNNSDTSSPNGNAPDTPPSSNGIGTGGTVAIVAVVVLLLFGIFGTAAFCCWKRKKKGSSQNGGHIMPSTACSTASDSVLLKVQVDGPNIRSDSLNGGMGNSRSWFTYEELIEATNGFSAENILGRGGFGSVYKGSLVDGRVVAVKQLNIGGGQGEREFRSEVEIISRIHHRQLVSLVGYCISDEKRLLVYEYVPNNTLYFHLHAEGWPVIDWGKRVKIAIGAARGLAYLHEDCHPRIIHRDIKSSNILLDNNFEARVADFGLAKLVAMDANTHITTRVMGTFGYMAPEYASSGKLTEKSDVYSYGVVLLELITGRKPVDTSQPLGEESLVEWARPLLSHAIDKEELESLADPRLEGDYVDGEMFQMIQAAAACVRHSASKRPKMGQVVRAFDNILMPDLSNGMKVGESEIYNSAQQSAEIRLFQRMAFGSHEYSTDFFSHSSSGVSEGNHVNSRSQSN